MVVLAQHPATPKNKENAIQKQMNDWYFLFIYLQLTSKSNCPFLAQQCQTFNILWQVRHTGNLSKQDRPI